MKKVKQIIIASLLLISIDNAYSQNEKLITPFSKSYEFESKKDYNSAIKSLMPFYDKQSYEMNLRLGWLYYKDGKYVESKNYYQLAMDLMPYAIEPQIGYIYPIVALNEMDKLNEQYNKILKTDPQDINSNYQLGYINYNKNNKDVAHKYFEKVINLYPSGYEPYLRETWTKMNNIKSPSEKVLEAFKKSYDFESKKQYKSAIDELMAVYDKNYYDLNLRLGWLNYIAMQDSDAVKYYKIAIDLKPTATEPRFGLVNAASELSNWEDVLNQYKKILEIDAQNTYALYGVGQIYYNRGDYSSAFPYFEKVVNLYPFTYKGLIMYAWTNYRIDKKREAKILFSKVLLLSPNDRSAMDGIDLLK